MIHWQYHCAKSLAQSDCCKFIASVSCYLAQLLSCCKGLQQLELALFRAIWLQESCDLIGWFLRHYCSFHTKNQLGHWIFVNRIFVIPHHTPIKHWIFVRKVVGRRPPSERSELWRGVLGRSPRLGLGLVLRLGTAFRVDLLPKINWVIGSSSMSFHINVY